MDDGESLNTYWGTTQSGAFEDFEDGTKLEGGQKYTALVFIQADPGYHLASDISVKVNGKNAPMYNFTDDAHQLRIYSDFTATHDLRLTQAKAATCEAGGNIRFWDCRSCKKCVCFQE